MAQPPGTVIWSFKPVGQLQRHELRERASFRCVRCRQHKASIKVATRGSDWAQILCDKCYLILANKQRQKASVTTREKAKPTERKKRRTGLAQQQRLNGLGTGSSVHQRTSIAAPRKLEKLLPGIDYMLTFFRDANIRAELVRGGRLLINGHLTRPLAAILPPPERIDWDNVINAMAVSYAADKFIGAVTDNGCFGEGYLACLRRPERAFTIMRGSARLATIHATCAKIPHRDVIRANFLTPGPHWQLAADVLRGAEPELIAEWRQKQQAREAAAAAAEAAETERRQAAAAIAAERKRAAARRRIDHLAGDLAPELRHACLQASRRIRLERQVAYDRPVILQCSLGDLTLLPITGSQPRLLLPFRLTTETATLTGELILEDHDPIPVQIREDTTDHDAITAWTCALLGFADATCIQMEPGARQHVPTKARRRQSSGPCRQHPTTRPVPRTQRWPQYLKPVGTWIRYSGSFVAGHRRRLNEGRSASAEAVDRARQVGITLHQNETWVKAHARGIPDGIEMSFRWHTPTHLNQLRGRTAPAQ